MREEFVERKIKGNITETIVQCMFNELGFYVLRLGQEYLVNPLTQIKQFVKQCNGEFDFENEMEELEFLKKLPDFVIIYKNGMVRFLEVRYRYNSEIRDEIFETLNRFPDCAILVVNSSVNEIIAKSNYGEVDFEPNKEEKEKLDKTRFHIWLLEEIEVSENDETYDTKYKTNTLVLSDWLKSEFDIENLELLKKYEDLVIEWYK